MNKITTLISILSIAGLFYSCEERPEMEYTIQAKHLSVQESTIYVDGFLAKGTPAFAGDENEPADRLGIPFVNGFGRKLSVKFIDRSSETGLTIEDGEVQLSYQGDKQYAYFPSVESLHKTVQYPFRLKFMKTEKNRNNRHQNNPYLAGRNSTSGT